MTSLWNSWKLQKSMRNLPIKHITMRSKRKLHNFTWIWLFPNAYNALTWNGNESKTSTKWMDNSKHTLQKSPFWTYGKWQLKIMCKILTQSTSLCCMKLSCVVWNLKKIAWAYHYLGLVGVDACQGTRHDWTM